MKIYRKFLGRYITDYDTILQYRNETSLFYVERVKNDINGNPLYKITCKSHMLMYSYRMNVYRNMLKRYKPYYLIQSYNIDNDMIEFIKEFSEKYDTEKIELKNKSGLDWFSDWKQIY